MKRGSVKIVLVIFIIGFVILNALGFYFGNLFTGNVVDGNGRISLDVGQKVYVDDKFLELKSVFHDQVTVSVNGIDAVIKLGNSKIVNGLKIDVFEISDGTVLFVQKIYENFLTVGDGRYELNFNQKMIVNGHIVTVSPLTSDSVLFKVDNVNQQLKLDESVKIGELIITLKGINNVLYGSVIFYAADASKELDCNGCKRFDLVSNDPVNVFDKKLTFLNVDDKENMKFLVDGNVKTIILNEASDLNGLQLYAESFKNSNDIYLDRVNVLVKEVVF